jgi:hypothetical protein
MERPGRDLPRKARGGGDDGSGSQGVEEVPRSEERDPDQQKGKSHPHSPVPEQGGQTHCVLSLKESPREGETP